METLVVGAGAMGRWVGKALLEDASGSVDLVFLDRDADVATEAARSVGGRGIQETDQDFEAVCIAVPLPMTRDAIADHAGRARSAIFDVTGTMEEPVEAMGIHADAIEQVSFHPLFSPENEPGNLAVVPERPGPVTDAVREAFESRGNELFETTPGEHDRAMETVQARTHTAVLAFALAAEEVPGQFQTPVSSTLNDLVEQVTSGEPHVYADIQGAFEGAEDVARAARTLADADRNRLVDLYEDTR